jgi:hypothetical protein
VAKCVAADRIRREGMSGDPEPHSLKKSWPGLCRPRRGLRIFWVPCPTTSVARRYDIAGILKQANTEYAKLQ